MRFASAAIVEHPVAAVYGTYRDRFDAIAVDTGNVERVTVPSRREVDGGAEMTHLWHGRGFIPRIARRLIAPQMLTWDAWVTWHDAEHRCDWRIAPRYFTACMQCSGEVRFTAIGGNLTRVAISGDLRITLETVAAVPRLLRAIVARRSERFLLAMVPRNLAGVARRCDRHLATDGGRQIA